MEFLCLLILLPLEGIYAIGTTEDSLETVIQTTLVPKLTSDELTIDDFIPVSPPELIRLISLRVVQPKGKFGKYTWYEDKNQTKYIFDVKPPEQVQKDIEEQLKNNTGLVCFHGFCVAPHLAKARLENSKAMQEKRLMPSYIPKFAVMVSFFIVAAVCGISGNVLIITGVLMSGEIRNSTTVLMSSLSVSDIVVLAVCLPMKVLSRFYRIYNIIPEGLCRFLTFVPDFSIATSTLTMATMAVERYIAICYPLKAKLYCTIRNSVVAICCIWIVAAGVCIPLIFTPVYEDTNERCEMRFGNFEKTMVYWTLRLLFVFAFPAFVLFPLYMKIAWVLWKSSIESNKLQSSSDTKQNSGHESLRARKQVIKMLVLLLIVFCLCWGPPVILDMVAYIRDKKLKQMSAVVRHEVSTALNSLGLCNSFFNPLILICMSRKIRSYLISMCRRMRKATKTERSSTITTNNTHLTSA